MRRIDLTSAAFLLAEKRETPMHVGAVNLFTLPDGVDEQKFLAGLMDVLRNAEEFREPFGEFVKTTPLGIYWDKDDNIDMDYHVRHSALPEPGRYRELFALASRLHSTLLDRHRPLWETHLIEGLANRQFAVYSKMHHAAIDGVGAMHLTRSSFSTSKSEHIDYSPYSLQAFERYKAEKYGEQPPKDREVRTVVEVLKQNFNSGVNVATAMRRFGSVFIGRGGDLAVPWHNVPKTSLNTQLASARRFVAQSWEMERVKAVSKAMDGTLNDIVLAMCSGALRRYLKSRNELLEHSLKAMVPVSLRREGDLESANAVSFVIADLATNIRDPEKRLRRIQSSMQASKSLLHDLSPGEAQLYTQLTQLPSAVTTMLGLGAKYPAYSTVISNVPGPREQLYWNGARLDGIYPASIVFDGFAMNITLVSYYKSLDFGIVAGRRSLPYVQRMIDYLEEALQELEEAAGLRAVKAKRKSKQQSKQQSKEQSKEQSKDKIGVNNWGPALGA